MRILVTGAGGYVGQNVCQALSKTDHEVIAFDRGFCNVAPVKMAVAFTSIKDIAVLPVRFLGDQIDVVIHLAGDISVPESVVNPNKYFANNVNETQHLLNMCRIGGVGHFVFASSAATYGAATGLLTESQAGNPINPYGWTKWIGEKMINEQNRMSSSKLRFFNIAGWDKKTKTGEKRENPYHLITMAAKAAVGERPSLKIFGDDYDTPDGTCVRDYVHVVDVADAIIKCALNGTAMTANVSYGKGYSVKEVAETMQQVKNFKIEYAARREGDPAMLVGDNKIIIHPSHGWEPQYKDNLFAICESAYLWELKNK